MLTARNGTQIIYQGFPSQPTSPTLFRPIRVEDSNGNYISIQYVAGKDQAISSVIDTVGRVLNFNYDGNGMLTSLTQRIAGGATKTYATFSWATLYGSGYNWYSFSLLGVGGAPPFTTALNVIAGCRYANGTGYSFIYGDWGVISKIVALASDGTTRSYVRYDFPAVGAGALSDAPSYQHQFVSSDGTTGAEEAWTYAVTEESARNVTSISVTDSSGTKTTSNLDQQGLVFNEVIEAAGTTLRTIANTWATDPGPTHIANYKLQQTVTTLNDSNQQSKVTYLHDSNGNVTDVKEYGYDGSLVRETASTYVPIGGRILDRPTQTLTKDGGGNTVSRIDYAYDQYSGASALSDNGSNVALNHNQSYSAGFTARGNLTSMTRYENAAAGTGAIARNLSYDLTGNVVSAQADCCTQVQSTYTANYQYAYPESIISGPSGGPQLTTSATYNLYTGLVATSTDENGQQTQFDYNDPMDRITRVTRPDGTQVNTGYVDSRQPSVSTSTTANNLAQSTTFDGLGRTIQQTTLNGTTAVTLVDTAYDTINRIVKIDNPHAPGEPQIWTTKQMDALGRVVSITPPSGGMYSSSYSGNSVTVNDPASKQKRSFTDAAGRLAQVDEPGASFAGASGSGTITINGNLQSTVVGASGATSGHNTVTITGGEQSEPDPNGADCRRVGTRLICPTIYDIGHVSISVNGYTKSASYGQNSSTGSIATALELAFHNDSAAPVDASLLGNVITLTARTTGAVTNYSLSGSSQTDDPTDFFGPSFHAGPAGATLIDGTNANPGTTVYDTGSVTLTVNGFQASASYGNPGNSNSSLIAGALAAALNGSGSPVHASASGNVISVWANAVGAATDYTISSGSSTSSQYFSSPSFSSAGTTLTNGADPYGNGIAHPYSTYYYTYSVLDELTNVNQGSQSRTFSYDGLGRLTAFAQPESGTTNYSYHTSTGGNCSPNSESICSRTDARSMVTTYAYDGLDRPTSISYNDGATATIGFTYDQGGAAAFAQGRLTTMTDGLGSETYQYDLLGRMTHLSKAVSGNTYSVGYGFNPDGTLSALTYPSGRVVSTSYDPIGRLTQIATAGTNLISNLAYNGADLPQSLNYGNGMQGQLGYNDHLQIQSLKYTQGASDLLDLSYGYGSSNNGQIQSITDNTNSARSTQYSYDPWLRLSAAQTTNLSASNTWALNWSYDLYGNRLTQSLVGGVGASITQPQLSVDAASNRITTGGYAYDAAGNMTSDSLNTYSYDGEDRIVNVNGTPSANYDGNGFRVQKGSTVYIYSGGQPIAEYNGASLVTEYVYGPSGLLATIPAGGSPSYSLGDHLSARLQMDAAANVSRNFGHFPFGETWYETGTASKWKFTSYERDADSNLDYAVNRAYSSRLGRFMQADPMGTAATDLSNPQSLNLYAYTLNNPISLADPSGLDPTCLLDGFSTPCPLVNNLVRDGAAGLGSPDAQTASFTEANGALQTALFLTYLTDEGYTYSFAGQFDYINSLGNTTTLTNAAIAEILGLPASNLLYASASSSSTNPCAGSSAAQLDYSSSKQHIIDDHLRSFQGLPSKHLDDSQYMFEGSIKTVDQAWAMILLFNAHSFTNPSTVSRVGNAYRFTAPYPIHPPAAYTGWERKKHPTIFGIPFYTSTPTVYNTVVVQTDCRTVNTSYPGQP